MEHKHAGSTTFGEYERKCGFPNGVNGFQFVHKLILGTCNCDVDIKFEVLWVTHTAVCSVNCEPCVGRASPRPAGL